VAKSVSSITVAATATDSGATLSGTGAVNLSEGTNTVSVVVTTADGTTKKTYAVTVDRASAIGLGDYVGRWATNSGGFDYAMVINPSGAVEYGVSNSNVLIKEIGTTAVNSSTGVATVTLSGGIRQFTYNYNSSADTLSLNDGEGNNPCTRSSGTPGTLVGVWTLGTAVYTINSDYSFTVKLDTDIYPGTANTTDSKMSYSVPSSGNFTVTIDVVASPHTVFESLYHMTLSRQ
jgi:hypothetical protein